MHENNIFASFYGEESLKLLKYLQVFHDHPKQTSFFFLKKKRSEYI